MNRRSLRVQKRYWQYAPKKKRKHKEHASCHFKNARTVDLSDCSPRKLHHSQLPSTFTAFQLFWHESPSANRCKFRGVSTPRQGQHEPNDNTWNPGLGSKDSSFGCLWGMSVFCLWYTGWLITMIDTFASSLFSWWLHDNPQKYLLSALCLGLQVDSVEKLTKPLLHTVYWLVDKEYHHWNWQIPPAWMINLQHQPSGYLSALKKTPTVPA